MNRQLFEYHPTFGYRFIPGLKARVHHEEGGYLFRTNAQGFRCSHDFVSSKPHGIARVLLFGDSFTAGDGVSNKHRYGDVLETLIDDLEVYNFGLSGSGTDQQYLIHREFGASIEHDVVVIGVLVENIRRVMARLRPFISDDGKPILLAKPYFELHSGGELSLHNTPVPRAPIVGDELLASQKQYIDQGGRLLWLRRTINAMGPSIKNLAQKLTHYQPLPEYDSPDSPAWKLMKAILRRWAVEINTPIIICPIPLYHYIEGLASPEGYRARFRELESLSGVTVHDPLEDFLAHSADARRGFRSKQDCHLTKMGHHVLAESLAPCVRRVIQKAGVQTE